MAYPTQPYPDSYPKVPPQDGPRQAPPSYGPPPVQQTIIMAQQQPRFTANPQQMQCPNCSADIMTEVTYENGMLVWLIFGSLFGLGFLLLFPWFLCCIPFCVDDCKDVHHQCPACKRFLGVYKRLS